ncbi:MAG: hypothetical protein ACOCU8_02865 [Patescibacteria group bacterium]
MQEYLENEPGLETSKDLLKNKKNLTGEIIIKWQGPEYEHQEKSKNWVWLVGLAVILGVIITIVLANFLLALILAIGFASLIFMALTPPRIIDFAITENGILIDSNLYLFKNIQAFALEEEEDTTRMSIHIDRLFLPHIILTLPSDIDPMEIKEILSEFIPEEEFRLSLAEELLRFLGF